MIFATIHIPEPDLASEGIARLSPLLNVSKLARLSDLNKNTLAGALRPLQRIRCSASVAGGSKKVFPDGFA